MHATDYDRVSNALLDEAASIERRKRPAYTIGSPDVLANFKRVAARVGCTPGQALAVYFLKHVDAVTSALCAPDIPQAEAVIGRFADAVNYLKLGWALLQDQEAQEKAEGEAALARAAGGAGNNVFSGEQLRLPFET